MRILCTYRVPLNILTQQASSRTALISSSATVSSTYHPTKQQCYNKFTLYLHLAVRCSSQMSTVIRDFLLKFAIMKFCWVNVWEVLWLWMTLCSWQNRYEDA